MDYKKFGSGIIIVRSEMSNFNADFTGSPRRLPDEKGTIYATDKALKYCIRKFLEEKNKNSVFAYRRRTEENEDKKKGEIFMNVTENYEEIFDKELPKNPSEILKDLLKCIDVRLFGVTFAPPKKEIGIDITGPVQISYGMNKFLGNENIDFRNQILSPYRSKEEGETRRTTIGEESKVLESHYVFDFAVNPNHLIERTKHISGGVKILSKEDIELFKEAARECVTKINSTTMIGSENEFLLYLESERPMALHNMKDFVTIQPAKEDAVKREINLENLGDYLFGKYGVLKNRKDEVSIEMYYDPNKVDVKGLSPEGVSISRFTIIDKAKIVESH